MSTLTPPALPLNLNLSTVIVGEPSTFDLTSILLDGPRPPAAPDFIPSETDEAERLALLAESDDHDSIMAAHYLADREAIMADHFDRWSFVSDDELIECRGHHPYQSYDR